MTQARRVRLVLRRIEPWTVLKFSLLLYASLYLVLLVAAITLWAAASVTGLRGSVESFVGDLVASKNFHFKGGELLRASVIGGTLVVLVGSGITVLLSVLHNLISDLIGGFGIVFEERPTHTAVAGANPPSAGVRPPRRSWSEDDTDPEPIEPRRPKAKAQPKPAPNPPRQPSPAPPVGPPSAAGAATVGAGGRRRGCERSANGPCRNQSRARRFSRGCGDQPRPPRRGPRPPTHLGPQRAPTRPESPLLHSRPLPASAPPPHPAPPHRPSHRRHPCPRRTAPPTPSQPPTPPVPSPDRAATPSQPPAPPAPATSPAAGSGPPSSGPSPSAPPGRPADPSPTRPASESPAPSAPADNGPGDATRPMPAGTNPSASSTDASTRTDLPRNGAPVPTADAPPPDGDVPPVPAGGPASIPSSSP